MAFCQQCGSPVGDSDAFCGNCGAKLAEAQPSANAQQTLENEAGNSAEKAEEPTDAAPQAEEAEAQANEESERNDAAAALDSLAEEPSCEASENAAAGQEATAGEIGTQDEQEAANAPSQTEPPAASAPAAPVAAPMPDFNSTTAYANQQAASPQQPYTQQAPYAQQAPYTQQPYAQQPYGAPYAAAYAQLEKGPLGKAWADFVAAPKKFFTLLKLALAMFLPGANELILSGYSRHWAKDAALGRKSPMPEKLIRPGVLDSGLYSYLVSFIVGLAFVLVTLAISALFDAMRVPDFITIIILLALFVIYIPASAVMEMRAVICSRVRDGFDFKEISNELFSSNKFGKIAIAAFVPGLIALAVAIVLMLLFFALFGLTGAIASMGHYGMSPYALNYASSYALFGLGFFGIIVLIVFLFAIFFVVAAAEIVSARAIGYIFEDFQPQNWKEYQENSAHYAKDVL